jgi:hypothetical protein
MCASLDGTGKIGEYIRTGLKYNEWLANFKEGTKHARHPRQMRIDFTLTLPGMFEVENIMKLSEELGAGVLAKVIFAFSPNIIMSPLALPRYLLDPWLDELETVASGAMLDILTQLRVRPTFEKQWPDTYQQGLVEGKRRMLQLESIRNQPITMQEILAARPEVLKWWNQIES